MELVFELKMLGYVAGAMFLGAVIGFEREAANKPAGMRTHMLVAGSAALLVFVSEVLVAQLGAEFGSGLVRGDPIRIVLSVVTGVAFLGAGAIIRHGGTSVEGLTTAATILFTAAVGMSVAAKEFVLAGGTTLLVVVTLRVLARLERWLRSKRLGMTNDEGQLTKE